MRMVAVLNVKYEEKLIEDRKDDVMAVRSNEF